MYRHASKCAGTCTVRYGTYSTKHVRRKAHAVVQDGDVSLSPSCNKLRVIDTAGATHMNIHSEKFPKSTQFMYYILDFLLKFNTTIRQLPAIIEPTTHKHSVVLRTTLNVLVYCV